jgi:hypothetical protein
MNVRLVTIRTFHSPVEANLAKSRLEEAGLQAVLLGEEATATGMMPAPGIQLQVAADDAERAQAVLDLPPEESPAEEAPPSEANEDEEREPNDRELNARSAFRGALLGLLLFPLQPYVSWLLLRTYLSDEEIRTSYLVQAWVAAAINIPVMLILGLWLRPLLINLVYLF